MNPAGRVPVGLTVASPVFSVSALHDLLAVEKAPYLDAVAAINASGTELSLQVTNAPQLCTGGKHRSARLQATRRGSYRYAAGDTPTRTTASSNPSRWNRQGEAWVSKGGMRYTFPPLSLTWLNFRRSQ